MGFRDKVAQIKALSPARVWTIPLSTHIGTDIKNETCSPSVEMGERRKAIEEKMSVKLKYRQVRPPIAGYNCFGLVFALRRTAIYDFDIDRIVSEDGYCRVDDPNEIHTGDVVLYRDDNVPIHVALVTHREDVLIWDGSSGGSQAWKVVSKFDDCSGEYEHRIDDFRWNHCSLTWEVYRARGASPQPAAVPPIDTNSRLIL